MKPPSRGENRSGRWTDRTSTTAANRLLSRTGNTADGPGDGHPAIRASYCCRDHSVERYKSALVCTACKVWIHGTGYRKDALRDSFLFEPSRWCIQTVGDLKNFVIFIDIINSQHNDLYRLICDKNTMKIKYCLSLKWGEIKIIY